MHQTHQYPISSSLSRLLRARLSLVMLLLCMAPLHADDFTLPAGFTIREVAGPELANDIYNITFSPAGDLVVSGRGYLKRLVDDNGDGTFDRVVLLSDHPKDGAMGLLIEGETLYFVGDGGLRRMPWRPSAFTKDSQLLLAAKTGGEHDAHAISRGPDGKLYWLCGNSTRIDRMVAGKLKGSPIAGGVLRLNDKFEIEEVVCDGLRNAYSFDWSLDGELYTFDSDNERCLGLPWYEGCRFLRLDLGGHYGWRTPQFGQSWRMPSYHGNCVPPVADLGRGSPTGVVCYRHSQFPAPCRGQFLLLDWTFGVIHQVDTQGKKSVFLSTKAGHGFAPTAAAVHPTTGDLYVSSGGRGTRGAVYRIRHETGYAARPMGKLQPVPLNEKSRTLCHLDKMEQDFEAYFQQFLRATSEQEQLQCLSSFQDQVSSFAPQSPEYSFQEGYRWRKSTLNKNQHDTLMRTLRQRLEDAPSPRLHRELTRTLALLKDDNPATMQHVLERITPHSSPIDDTHCLFVLACLTAKPTTEQRKALATALLNLDGKYDKLKLPRERHWPLRVAEAVRALIDHDPELASVLVKHPALGHLQQLEFLTDRRLDQTALAEVYWQRVQRDRDLDWTPRLATVLQSLPHAELGKLARKKWDDAHLRDALLPIIAKSVSDADRGILNDALRGFSQEGVKLALASLSKLPSPNGEAQLDELAALLAAYRQWRPITPKLSDVIMQRIIHHVPGKWVAGPPDAVDRQSLSRFPALKQRLSNSDGIDRDTWLKAHSQVPWDTPRLDVGEKLFTKHCASCHAGSTALGPDLAGVGKRFSRDDLLTAMLEPSKDVSPRYRTSVFVTKSGQTHVGLVIYEAIDGVILQTSASASIRIPGNELGVQRTTSKSLMPAGLLDKLSDQEVADLMGWLRR
jgi:putative heme-binding domain-containing protein